MLTELTSTLRTAVAATPGLAGVTLAGGPGASASSQPHALASLPAATLALIDCKPAPASGAAEFDLDGLVRAGFELTLWRRDPDPASNVAALNALADRVCAVIVADTTLVGQLAAGPSGAAVEVLAVAEKSKNSMPPLGALVLRIGCWLVPAEAVRPLPSNAQVVVDSDRLFASGPHALSVDGWHRRRVDRQFAGLNGTLSVDLGASHRPMSLTGRLTASSVQQLAGLVRALDGLNDGLPHEVVAPTGQSFANVRIEQVRWGRMLGPGLGKPACIGYRLALTQLAE